MNIQLAQLAQAPASKRITSFVLLLAMLWLPFALPLYYFGHHTVWASPLALLLLYVEFLLLVAWWGKRVYQSSGLFRQYGLVWTRSNGQEYLMGLGLGLGSLLGLFLIQAALGWLVWRSPPSWRVIAEGLLLGGAIGFAEELLFRGWLWDELRRDYSFKISLWVNSLIFATLHFIKPLAEILRTAWQFPGLVMLAMIMIRAKGATHHRLGLSMGLHAGLVWGYYLVSVGQWVRYTGQVPPWVTGVDHNPLMGASGLGCLALLLWLITQRDRGQTLID
ncbi:CPBP family intramembrane metalloprotease [Trichothermofontia sichuanensis B231]|uniref:CPBP family intramembrane glutamic endopeptidase n=1 Tax=Trichothermofontia sichuanensis TaxID=3045816 RepID=UPI0022461E33|nr:CPBP family intramembrane glutamic endopeptidase [Trichothermofontia sichuanensis]UZQ54872.1 CPBP family intramembrane metalloprotease [Trichothermofontia sichuanensis B231]